MKRRTFIQFSVITSLLFTTNVAIAKNIPTKSLVLLEEIYNVIFPKTNNMPSSKEFGALEYLVQNIAHKTFDDSDKTFILDGAVDFSNSFPSFLSLSNKEKKELIFSIIKNSSYAKSWISKLTYYGLEAMYSDSIYGGNRKLSGWNSIKHNIGYPRPSKTYGQKI